MAGSRARGAQSNKTDWHKLAERDPVECAHQALKRYESEFEKAFKTATVRSEWEDVDWWETWDQVRLAQPRIAEWGPVLFPMAYWDSFGRRNEMYYTGANVYKLTTEELLEAISEIERGQEPSLPDQEPYPSFGDYFAIEDALHRPR
jgi:hypothetical protein